MLSAGHCAGAHTVASSRAGSARQSRKTWLGAVLANASVDWQCMLTGRAATPCVEPVATVDGCHVRVCRPDARKVGYQVTTNQPEFNVGTKLAPLPQRHSDSGGSSRRIIKGIAIVVLLAIVAALVYTAIHARDQFSANEAVTEFCTAEVQGDYTKAYALLSQQSQQQISLDQLKRNAQDANLASCSTTTFFGFLDANGNTTRVPVSIGTAASSTSDVVQADGTAVLVRESGGWRIDAQHSDMSSLFTATSS